MTTTVVYSGTNDGYVVCSSGDFEYGPNGSYADARSGASAKYAYPSQSLYIGQDIYVDFYTQYACHESFLEFDTTGIDDGDTVSDAVLNLKSQYDISTTDFIIEVRARNWGGGTLTTGSYVAGASLGSDTLVASRNTSSGWTPNTAYDLTSETAFAGAIQKTANTRLSISSSRQRNNNTPTNSELVSAYAADETGTTSDPKLTITHSAAAPTGTAASTFKFSESATGQRSRRGTNWIDNPSFETDLSGWTNDGPGFLQPVTAYSRVTVDNAPNAGSACMGLEFSSAINEGITYPMPGTFRKGVTYSFSIAMKWLSGISPQVFFYSPATGAEGGHAGDVAHDQAWHTLKGTWTPTTDYSDVVLAVRNADFGAATARIDDVRVVASNWVSNPDFTSDTTDWNLTPIRGGGGSSITRRTAHGFAAMTNVGFESGDLTGWSTLGDVGVEAHNNGANGWLGTYRAVLHKVIADQYCMIQGSGFEAPAGDRVELNALVSSGDGATVQFQIVCLNSSFEEIAYPNASHTLTNDNNNPLRLSSGVITLPANTWAVVPRVFNTTNSTYLCVDDVTLIFHDDYPADEYVGDVVSNAAFGGMGTTVDGPFLSGRQYGFSVELQNYTGDNYVVYGLAAIDNNADYAEAAPHIYGQPYPFTYKWTPSANHAHAGLYAVTVGADYTSLRLTGAWVNELIDGPAASTFKSSVAATGSVVISGTSAAIFKFSPAATGTEVISGTGASTFKFSHAATGMETADYVSVANVAAHDLLTGNFSIELWYKRASTDSAGYLYYEPGGVYIESLWDGSIYFGSPGVGDAGVYAAPDDAGVWHHLVITKGATATSWKLYFDGVDDTPAEIFSSTPSSGEGQSKRFASSDGNTGWQGSLDEVAIYKSVLSAERVAAHYNAAVPVTEVTGTAATTFRFTPQATGTETISGTSAATFKFTPQATGIETLTGTAASTWKFSSAASGTESMAGTSAATFKYSTAATGAETLSGTSAATFKYSTAATGTETLSGAAATTWRFSVAGTGAETLTGAAASGPWKFSTAASGTSLEGTTGLGSSTFGYSTAATGFVSTAGEAASTFKFSHEATGAEAITGTSATTFKFSEAATGTNTAPVMTGTSATTFRFTPAASGWHSISGAAAITWTFSHAATGEQQAQVITGTSATAFPFTTEVTGEETISGTSDTTFRLATEATGATYIPPIGTADSTFKFSPAATGEEIITGTAATTWRARPYVTGSSAELVYGTAASGWKFAPYAVGYEDITYTGTAASGAWKFGVATTGVVHATGAAASTFKFGGSAAGYAPITGEAATSFGYSTGIIGLTAAAGSVIGESHLTDFGWSTEIVKVTGAEGLVTQRSADTTWVSMA